MHCYLYSRPRRTPSRASGPSSSGTRARHQDGDSSDEEERARPTQRMRVDDISRLKDRVTHLERESDQLKASEAKATNRYSKTKKALISLDTSAKQNREQLEHLQGTLELTQALMVRIETEAPMSQAKQQELETVKDNALNVRVIYMYVRFFDKPCSGCLAGAHASHDGCGQER
jgi:chromosome segregation ATPase